MQARTISLLLAGFAMTGSIQGQTNFIYDQQSATEGANAETGGSLNFAQPYGQSFTPSFNSVGFIRLWMYDNYPSNGLGAVVFVNLLSNSISGPILGSTDPVTLADGFGSGGNQVYPNFFFSNPVSLVTGVTYFLQPIVQTGDVVTVNADITYNYPGGNAFYQGAANPNHDLWFREGVITVPEPSVAALGAVGLAGWVGWLVRRRVRAAQKV
ncbi:MAG: hypothetical protein HY301_11535 [Verrucomicrobia bacterium]|nr:hypothetical protein [Verrucomicrobiota bacterium]